MSNFWQPVQLSLLVAGSATMLVSIIGIILAWFMAKKRFPGKIIVEVVFLLPIFLPPTVIGFLLIMIVGRNGIIGRFITYLFEQSIMFTVWGAILAAMVVAFPLLYQAAKVGFLAIDQSIEGAAKVDGANNWHVFRFISFPLCFPSIVMGAVLSFARSIGEFGATIMFAGNIPGKTQTIPLAVYVAFESNQLTLAWCWVIVIIVISFLLLLFLQKKGYTRT